jgi:two-component system repressor protein LuxO
MAVAAMRAGAMDYLVKPCDPTRLETTLHNVLQHRSLRSLVESYRQRYESDGFCDFIGSSPAMQAVYRTIEAAAASAATIFITGESGTGKELCAAAIHDLSARRDKPFAILNCAAIPLTLMESELFGHTKGAFTGATAARQGVVRRAHGGTLFLDEICDMPLELQAKLLRLVQTGSFRAVGSDATETADLRFVCATNRDPLAEVAAGRFREDLFYRMHVIPIHLPPLSERGRDVLAIAARLLDDYSREEGRRFEGFGPDAARALLAYPWPGNVRELQNVIRRVVVLNEGRVVTAAMLPEPVRGPWQGGAAPDLAAPVPQLPARRSPPRAAGVIRPLRLVEETAIEDAIELCGGNIRRAAALLEVSPSTIYRRRRPDRARSLPRAAVSHSDTAAGAAQSPSSRSHCLDERVLKSLEDALGRETVARLLQRHVEDMRRRFAMLDGAAKKDDIAGLRRQAHDLKSMCGSFGAARVQELAADIERMCREGDAVHALALVEPLTEAGRAALAALAARYARKPDAA